MMHDEISMQNQMQKTDEEEEIHFGATRTVGDVLMGRISGALSEKISPMQKSA